MKNKGFYFDPKLWLGDANILTMDWDCKGMHMQLIALSWQQDPVGHLLFDENLILRLIGSPDVEDWKKRIKPQLQRVWVERVIEGQLYWVNESLIELQNKITARPAARKRAAKKVVKTNSLSILEPIFQGVNIVDLMKKRPALTILYEEPKDEERLSIWSLGVDLLLEQDSDEKKVRSYLAGMIKRYGEKELALALTDLSLRSKRPVDIQSYLTGILRNRSMGEEKNRRKSARKGLVAL